MKPKFKVGDKVRVVNSDFDEGYEKMIGKIVTISSVEPYENRGVGITEYNYRIEEEYYRDEDPEYPDGDGELLDFFYERELELFIQINPRDLLLKKLK